MPNDTPKKASTLSVHAGEPRSYPYDALTAPVVQTATYSFAKTKDLIEYMQGLTEREEYGRYGNPTVRLVEDKLAQLEGAQDAAAFSSGMAAITSVLFALCTKDSHVVLFSDCYRRTRQFVTTFLERYGVSHTLVDPGELDQLEKAIRPETKLVVSELPTNPYLSIVDVEKLAQLCRAKKVKSLIDATFATPVNLKALNYGIDLVVHSASKYLAGHNDVLCGVLAGNSGLVSLARDVRHVLGGICDPQAAFLVHRGLKTLALRVEQQNRSGQRIAEFLEQHPNIERVWYPGLSSHPPARFGVALA